MRISSSPGIGVPATRQAPNAQINLERVYPARDVALLTFIDPWEAPPALEVAPGRLGASLVVAGFPRCGPLQISRGAVQRLGALTFEGSALSDFGGSGSPVFTESAAAIAAAGIVSQAVVSPDALLRIVTGRRFPASASRIDNLPQELSHEGAAEAASSLTLVAPEYVALLKHYEEQTQGAAGISRIAASLDFAGRVEALRHWELIQSVNAERELVKAPSRLPSETNQLWSYLGEHPDSGLAAEGRNHELLELIYLYNFEEHGARKSALQLLSSEEQQALSVTFGAPWKNALTKFMKSPSPGITLLLLSEGGAAAILVGLVLVFWGISVGLVCALSQGGLLKKSLMGLLVGVAGWPLSFFVWCVLKAKAPVKNTR